jgi:DNA-directed RNA polymerase subunit omega
MIDPSIGDLLKKVDNSRYTLVVATAKRARQITEGSHKLTKCNSDKTVTIAINEINENKITYVRTKSGIK